MTEIKLFDAENEDGSPKYGVCVGKTHLFFASAEEREKYLYFLYWAEKAKKQAVLDALVLLWASQTKQHRKVEILEVMNRYFINFSALLLVMADMPAPFGPFLIQSQITLFIDSLVNLPAQTPSHKEQCKQENRAGSPGLKDFLSDFVVEKKSETPAPQITSSISPRG